MSGAQVNSAAYFSARIISLELTPFAQQFHDLGSRPFGRLAFSTSYIPGISDGALLDKGLMIKVMGRADHHDACQLRLFFDAYTLVSVDLRRQVERSEDDLPRRLPVAERGSRRATLAAKLPGMTREGELVPSNRLQDIAKDMYEEMCSGTSLGRIAQRGIWESQVRRRTKLGRRDLMARFALSQWTHMSPRFMVPRTFSSTIASRGDEWSLGWRTCSVSRTMNSLSTCS